MEIRNKNIIGCEPKLNLYFFLIPVLFLLFSCSKKNTTVEALDLGYDYYPLDSGWVRVYSVDSIAYNDNTSSIDTFHFTLTEQTSGKISGQDLAAHTEIKTIVLKDSSILPEPRNSYFVLQTSNNLQKVEDNIRIVKLVFPVGNVLSWNGNQYNNLGKKTFQLLGNGAAYNNGDTTFQNCLLVQEALANNAVEEILVKSVYCKGLGLVDFTNNYINTQVSGRLGYKVHYKLKNYYRP